MKRYFILAGIEHEGKNGKWAKAEDCFDLKAEEDGLFLICPSGEKINLFDSEVKPLMEIWQDLKNAEIAEDEVWA